MKNKKYLSYCECLELAGKCAAKGLLSGNTKQVLSVADSIMKNPDEQRLLRKIYVESGGR